MSKKNGWMPLRRGLWEHVRDGRMSITGALAFLRTCSEADTRTGVCRSSAKSLASDLGISERTARDVHEKLEHGGYIRRFAVPGRHFCYPILVHKFPITEGEHKGERLNAMDSKNPVELAYFPREHNGEHGVEHVASQRRIENREQRQKKHPAAKTAPPADPRFQPLFDYAYEDYRVKHQRSPIWTGKDTHALKGLLAGHSPVALPIERLQALWRSYTASTEAFTAKQGDSLAYFCSNIDKFSDGPILEHKKTGGNANGKSTIGDAMRVTLDAFRTNKSKPH
jgi:hypothetical protein